jgi:Fe2+ or Zn2+ uptake regulation protein
VLSILHAADRPLSVDDILHADPALPQSSTYRDLRVLLDAGIVIPRYLTEDRARFETASSRTTGPSVHFVCTECGTIAQIAAGEDIERAVSSATRGAQRDQGFTTDLTQLLARGRCRRCATHVLTLPHDAAGDARSDQ